MVVIRLTRRGRKHEPVYNIVAADSRRARNGAFLEKLGLYHPNTETELSNLRTEELKSWVNKGAILSDTVRTLLKKNKIVL